MVLKKKKKDVLSTSRPVKIQSKLRKKDGYSKLEIKSFMMYRKVRVEFILKEGNL